MPSDLPPTGSSAIDVAYVADLARLHLSGEEADTFQRQLADVLGYVKQLSLVDVSSVGDLEDQKLPNHLRPDILQPSLTADEALANAPAQDNHLFVMPKIVD